MFLLIIFVALTAILVVAVQSLGEDRRVHAVDIDFSSTSDWARVDIEGASIYDVDDKDPSGAISYEGNSLMLKGPGKGNAQVNLNVTEGFVRFYLSKGSAGEATAEIKDIGLLENSFRPVSLPMHIQTNSSYAKVSFSGMKLVDASPTRGAKESFFDTGENCIILENPKGNQVDVNITANFSFDEDLPTVLLEKDDKGILQTKIGEYTYYNNRTGGRTIDNILFEVNMTSNKSQIFFEGGEITRAKAIQVDSQDLLQNTVGENFIYLYYAHNGDSPRKASYLLDFKEGRPKNITIYKNNVGSVDVTIGGRSFSCSGNESDLPYVSESFVLPDLDAYKGEEGEFASFLHDLSQMVEGNAIYNPAAYIFPAQTVLYAMGLSKEDTKPQSVSLFVEAEKIPMKGFRLDEPVAKGAIIYVILSYAILILFGLQISGSISRPKAIGKGAGLDRPQLEASHADGTKERIWTWAVGIFEEWPISSVLIFDALIALAVTPFILMQSEPLANDAAIAAYLLLVAGVGARFLEMTERVHLDAVKQRLLKVEALTTIVATGFILGFKANNPEAGRLLIMVMAIAAGAFILLVYIYLRSSPLLMMFSRQLKSIEN